MYDPWYNYWTSSSSKARYSKTNGSCTATMPSKVSLSSTTDSSLLCSSSNFTKSRAMSAKSLNSQNFSSFSNSWRFQEAIGLVNLQLGENVAARNLNVMFPFWTFTIQYTGVSRSLNAHLQVVILDNNRSLSRIATWAFLKECKMASTAALQVQVHEAGGLQRRQAGTAFADLLSAMEALPEAFLAGKSWIFITELRLLHLWVHSSPVMLGC